MGGPGIRADIQGLRALSVALVVAFHLHLRGSGGGFIGVDVFFVISGYLMTRLVTADLAEGGLRYRRFVAARAARIWPALAALVVAFGALGCWLLPPFDLLALAEQAAHALLFVSNRHALAHAGYDTAQGDANWFLHTWSLSVEWQFYLLYPLWLAAAAAAGRRLAGPGERVQRRALLSAVSVLALGSFSAYLLVVQRAPDAAFFLLPTRAWELAAGGLAYLLQPPGAPGRGRIALSHVALAGLLLSALWIGMRHLPPVGLGVYTLAPVLATALLLGAGHADNRWLRTAYLQRLGAWSYSIYLWHWPVIVALRMADVFNIHPRLGSLVAGAASLALGAASHRWLERPRPWAGAGAAWQRMRAPAAWVLGAGALCALLVVTQGLAGRGRTGAEFFAGYPASIKPFYYPDACSNFLKPAHEAQLCTLDKPDTRRRILVIGDSHGEHFYAWYAAHSPVPVDFFTMAECPPVPHFERLQPGYHCQDYAAEAWRRAALPIYDTVVVSARWAGVGLAGAPYCHEQAPGRCVTPAEGADKQQRVRRELRTALEALLARGKTVVVPLASPESSARVPERLAREIFWFGAPRLHIERASLDQLAGWIDPLFDELNRQHPGFVLVSLRERLCEGSACRVFDERLNRPIYLDESHFDPVWLAAQPDLRGLLGR